MVNRLNAQLVINPLIDFTALMQQMNRAQERIKTVAKKTRTGEYATTGAAKTQSTIAVNKLGAAQNQMNSAKAQASAYNEQTKKAWAPLSGMRGDIGRATVKQQQWKDAEAKLNAWEKKNADMQARMSKRGDLYEKARLNKTRAANRAETADLKAKEKEQANIIKAAENKKVAEVKASSEKIKNAFSAAFSLHIITQFVSPFFNRLQNLMRQTIDEFAEFDKLYADYLAKSTDFLTTASRQDIFGMQAGMTYGIGDVASTMERFSASGIDVTKSTQSVADVLQVATVAQVDYKDASNAIIKTMEAFHLSTSKTTMIVDSMTAAANASTAELEDMIEWFEYAAGSAYVAGLEVHDLSAYLGILSSAGLKNVGTSFRQFLVQFQKADVREKFGAKFGFATEDFRDMNKVINTMRDYVQNSGDATAAAEELTQILGGKVNAMQALQQLLVAQPELWNRLHVAVQENGTTAELYANATNNAAHSIERIQTAVQSLYVQIGEVFAPVLRLAADLLGGFVKIVSAIPGPIRALGGILVVAVGIASSLALAFVTLESLMFVLTGVTEMLNKGQMGLGFSYKYVTSTVWEFIRALTAKGEVVAMDATLSSMASAANYKLGASTEMAGNSFQLAAGKMGMMRVQMISTFAAMAGFALTSKAVESKSYTMARALTVLTAAIIAFQLAATGHLVLATAALVGLTAYGWNQIDRAQLESTIATRGTLSNKTGTSASTTVVNNNVSINGMTMQGVTTDTTYGEMMEAFYE